MKIIALTIGSYPKGEATTNRNLSLLKGLKELGNEIELMVLFSTRKLLKGEIKVKGVIDDIPFLYTSLTVKFYKNIFFQSLVIIWSIINSLFILYKSHKKSKIDAVLILLSEPYLIYPFILFSKLLKIKIFHEQTETPELNIISKNLINQLNYKYYLKLISKFDGIYVISTYLKEYFSNYIFSENICIINMTVDFNRFLIKEESPVEFPFILYCGTMYGNKDGVEDLINSYEKIHHKIDHKLVMIGDIKDRRSKYVINLINKKNLSDKIHLTGSIESTEIPRWMMNSKLQLLCRPNNLQSKAGFPTKLGEYLISEIPVLVTSVGDIPFFIIDGSNGYLSKPNDTNYFSKKIIEILTDKNAVKVGLNGKETALKNFNYKIESLKLNNFILNIINK